MLTSFALVSSLLLITWCSGEEEEAMCSPVFVPLGSATLLEPKDGKAPIGTKLRYGCDEGTNIQQHFWPYAKCVHPGRWNNGPPNCYKQCPVPRIENGRARVLIYRTGWSWNSHMGQLQIHCNNWRHEKYVNKYPEENKVICLNGTWNMRNKDKAFLPAHPFTCVPAPCGVTSRGTTYKSGGEILTSGKIPHDSHVTVHCNPGYEGVEDGADLKCDRGILKPKENRYCHRSQNQRRDFI